MINFGTPPTNSTGGAGIAGLVQGMRQAQQDTDAQDKIGMLKDQLDMQKKNFEFADLQQRGNKLNQLMWSAEKSKNFDAVNSFLADKANSALGGGAINVLDQGQAPRELDGKLSNQFLNKYKSDTGNDYVENSPLMTYTNGEGSRYFTPDTFAAGSGYGKFRRDAKLAEDLTQAQILDKLTPDAKKQGTDKKRWLSENLLLEKKMDETPEEMTPDDYRQYRANSIQLSALKPNANRTLSSDVYAPEMKILRDGKSPSNISDKRIAEMKLTEADAGNKYNDTATKIGLNTTSIGTLNKLRNNLIKLKDGDIAGGTIENALVDASKYLSSKAFQELDPAEQRKALQTIRTRSGIGMATAQILQAISGATVPEEEYNRILENLVGGNLKDINIEGVISALEGATGTMYDGAKGNISNISDYVNPGTKAEMAKNLDKAWNPSTYEITSTDKKKLSDVPSEIIKDKRTKFGKFLEDVDAPEWIRNLVTSDKELTASEEEKINTWQRQQDVPGVESGEEFRMTNDTRNKKLRSSKTPLEDLLKEFDNDEEKMFEYIKKNAKSIPNVAKLFNAKYFPDGAK